MNPNTFSGILSDSYLCCGMTVTRKIEKGISLGRFLSICLMFFCLSFLTTLNYFLYPSGDEISSTIVSGSNSEDSDSAYDFPPSGPTEEKSSTSSVSIVEEILHENHPLINFEASNHFYLHHIAEADKIEMFHPESVSPPPKLAS